MTGGESLSGRMLPTSAQSGDAHETPQTSIGDKERKSVAILPFKNLSNDPETAFYEFSLADAVITELARVRSLDRSPLISNREISGQAT